MKSFKFYTAERHDNKRTKVKKEGYIEEYDGFRLCAFKINNKWWVIEEISGLACIPSPIRNLKDAFKTGAENIKKLAEAQEMSIARFIAHYPNVNGYEEFEYDTDNKQ